jgi:hypothetical protein
MHIPLSARFYSEMANRGSVCACTVYPLGGLRCAARTLPPRLRWLHIASLLWGILTELLPWPCPLTLVENWLEGRAGVAPYQGGFLPHYLGKLVYPDISAKILTVAGVIVCALNLGFYGLKLARWE